MILPKLAHLPALGAVAVRFASAIDAAVPTPTQPANSTSDADAAATDTDTPTYSPITDFPTYSPVASGTLSGPCFKLISRIILEGPDQNAEVSEMELAIACCQFSEDGEALIHPYCDALDCVDPASPGVLDLTCDCGVMLNLYADDAMWGLQWGLLGEATDAALLGSCCAPGGEGRVQDAISCIEAS